MHSVTKSDGLSGKTALVTGASRGIGRAIALAMAEQGADLILTARSKDSLENVASSIQSLGRKASIVVCDLSDHEAVTQLTKGAVEVDVLVNNAGDNGQLAPLVDSDLNASKRLFDIDFWSPIILMREIGRSMLARGQGSIINISSIVSEKHAPGVSDYCAAKAALNAISRTAALEMGPGGVRINVVSPGFIETDMTLGSMSEAEQAHMIKSIPLGRAGQSEQVASLCVWLASDAASFVTGQVINVDGGATAGDFEYAGAE